MDQDQARIACAERTLERVQKLCADTPVAYASDAAGCLLGAAVGLLFSAGASEAEIRKQLDDVIMLVAQVQAAGGMMVGGSG